MALTLEILESAKKQKGIRIRMSTTNTQKKDRKTNTQKKNERMGKDGERNTNKMRKGGKEETKETCRAEGM